VKYNLDRMFQPRLPIVAREWRVIFGTPNVSKRKGPQVIVSAKDSVEAAGLALGKFFSHPMRDPNLIYTIVMVSEHV
jgi:hypothetical protein